MPKVTKVVIAHKFLGGAAKRYVDKVPASPNVRDGRIQAFWAGAVAASMAAGRPDAAAAYFSWFENLLGRDAYENNRKIAETTEFDEDAHTIN